MGTRSLTIFDGRQEVAVLYRQFDGYPEGHGRELADFLAGYRITDGKQAGRTANGMECLAAQVIAHFKRGPGEFYLQPAGTRNCGEEYRYLVYGAAGMEPRVRVEAVQGWLTALEAQPVELLFDGTATAMAQWIGERWPNLELEESEPSVSDAWLTAVIAPWNDQERQAVAAWLQRMAQTAGIDDTQGEVKP